MKKTTTTGALTNRKVSRKKKYFYFMQIKKKINKFNKNLNKPSWIKNIQNFN